MSWDATYRNMVKFILARGYPKISRGHATTSIFDYHYQIDASRLPILTTKKISFKNIVSELLWFLGGHTDVAWLHTYGNHIWDEWASKTEWSDFEIPGYRKHPNGKWLRAAGTIDAGYGRLWRNFGGVDQIAWIVKTLKNDPTSRRMVVSAWNPAEHITARLPPCHDMWIINVLNIGGVNTLNLSLTQRSADVGLGVPYNTTSYCLLMHLLARETGLAVGVFGHTLVDCHIYDNHRIGLLEQMKRPSITAADLRIATDIPLFDLKVSDITLEGYVCHPALALPIAI